MPIHRKRSASNKVYLPQTTRDNQYILAEFPVTEALLEKYGTENVSADNKDKQYQSFCRKVADDFFAITEKYGLSNVNFIANGKFPTVSYSQESIYVKTEREILFHYDPKHHTGQRIFLDDDVKAKKISLLLLATGEDIRFNSPDFHKQCREALKEFAQEIGLEEKSIRLRDHQHRTYDIFAADKGHRETKAHKLRLIHERYASKEVELPEDSRSLTYAVVQLPLTRKIQKLADIDLEAQDPYNPLYSMIADALAKSAKSFNLNNGAVIANGLKPIVRYNEHESMEVKNGFQMIGYNPDKSYSGIVCKWNPAELVDDIYLVFLATKLNKGEHGYGNFLSHIQKALKKLANELELDGAHDEMIVRFHQHIAYDL